MKKHGAVLLILAILLVSVLAGCLFYKVYQKQKLLKELPKAAHDDLHNFVFLGETYLSVDDLPDALAYGFVPEKSHTVGYWEGVYGAHPVYAYGMEDFGAHICLEIWSEFPMANKNWLYLKSSFTFPNPITLRCSTISFAGSVYESNTESVDVACFAEAENITLQDIVTETKKPEKDLVYQGNVHVYFHDYQTIYLEDTSLYLHGDQLYLCIGSRGGAEFYLIRDTYQTTFKNAISQYTQLTD